MSQDSKVLIDSNILVYAADRLSDNHLVAIRILSKYLEVGVAAVSAQNLAEFTFVVTEKLRKMSLEDSSQFVKAIADNAFVISYDAGDVFRANQIKHSYGVPFYDSLLVAVMEKADISTIITANERDFKKINWLEVVNPFRR